MSCGRFEQRLHYLLRQAVSSVKQRGALRRHAEDCQHCSRLLVAQERLFAGLESSRPKAPDWDVADYVVRTAQRLAIQRQRRGRHGLGMAALSAAVGLAATLALLVQPADTPPQRVSSGALAAVPSRPEIERSPRYVPLARPLGASRLHGPTHRRR